MRLVACRPTQLELTEWQGKKFTKTAAYHLILELTVRAVDASQQTTGLRKKRLPFRA